MPLDQEISRVIEAVRTANAPRTDQVPLAVARGLFRDRYRARSVPPDAGVSSRDLSWETPAGELRARLYRPVSAPSAEKLPLVIYFHGGGFVLGDADAYEAQSTALVSRGGCALLFVEYRLAPEFPFPAAIADAIEAVQWAAANAHELGADPSRLAVMGDSAGANLAVNACIAARESSGPAIKLQCLLYPAVDYRYLVGGESSPSLDQYANGFLLDRATREWFFSQYFTDPTQAFDPRGSVVIADLSALPPALVVTAECDPLRDLGKAFYDRLVAHGSAAEYRCVEGMVHNFLGYSGVSQVARRALLELGDWLHAKLHR